MGFQFVTWRSIAFCVSTTRRRYCVPNLTRIFSAFWYVGMASKSETHVPLVAAILHSPSSRFPSTRKYASSVNAIAWKSVLMTLFGSKRQPTEPPYLRMSRSHRTQAIPHITILLSRLPDVVLHWPTRQRVVQVAAVVSHEDLEVSRISRARTAHTETKAVPSITRGTLSAGSAVDRVRASSALCGP